MVRHVWEILGTLLQTHNPHHYVKGSEQFTHSTLLTQHVPNCLEYENSPPLINRHWKILE